jgi:hypothetical protein
LLPDASPPPPRKNAVTNLRTNENKFLECSDNGRRIHRIFIQMLVRPCAVVPILERLLERSISYVYPPNTSLKPHSAYCTLRGIGRVAFTLLLFLRSFL